MKDIYQNITDQGHASLKSTAIYGDVIGPEESAFAARMWSRSLK